jgi:WD40 repeat protein
LRIVSANGQELSVKRWDAQWRLAGWYDNERIAVEAPNGAEKTMLILNLATGETEAITLPPLYNPYSGDLILKGPEANYNQTYTQVMYLTDDFTYALWDLRTNKLLWQKISRGEGLYGSKWSSDEQQIAVASEIELNKAELYSLDAGGQETQLTDFEAAYPSMNITIGSFDWSPDGRYISLWLNIRPDEYLKEWRFALLDVQTGQVTDYCVTTSDNFPVDAIWSPSGQLLAVPLFSHINDGDGYSFMLLDIVKNLAIKITLPDLYGLLGWMADP